MIIVIIVITQLMIIVLLNFNNRPALIHTIIVIINVHMHVYDVIGDVERKKEKHLRQWKNENESCLRWDLNPRHSVLQTDALPTELPRQLSW